MTNQDPEIADLTARLDRIEARQRTASDHDPDCALIKSIQAHHCRHVHVDENGRGTMDLVKFNPAKCDCWLSRPSTL